MDGEAIEKGKDQGGKEQTRTRWGRESRNRLAERRNNDKLVVLRGGNERGEGGRCAEFQWRWCTLCRLLAGFPCINCEYCDAEADWHGGGGAREGHCQGLATGPDQSWPGLGCTLQVPASAVQGQELRRTGGRKERMDGQAGTLGKRMGRELCLRRKVASSTAICDCEGRCEEHTTGITVELHRDWTEV